MRLEERVNALPEGPRAVAARHLSSMYRIRRNVPSMFNPRRRRRFERHGQVVGQILAQAEKA